MCGIVGIFSRSTFGMTAHDGDALNSSLILNQFRGSDSTGIVTVHKGGVWDWVKNAEPAYQFIKHKSYIKRLDGLINDGVAVFGHGRAATRGTVDTDNAHPFEETTPEGDKILLIHNGTLGAHQPLGGLHKFKVDSHWMAAMIAEHGPEHALSMIRGPVATVWYNSATKKIYMYRNYERPLVFAWTKDRMYINSEKEGIAWLKYRRNLNDLSLENMFDFEPGKLYTYDPLSKEEFNGKDSLFESIKEIKPEYPVWTQPQPTHRLPFREEEDEEEREIRIASRNWTFQESIEAVRDGKIQQLSMRDKWVSYHMQGRTGSVQVYKEEEAFHKYTCIYKRGDGAVIGVTRVQDPSTKILIQDQLFAPEKAGDPKKPSGGRFRDTILDEVKLKVRPSGLFKFNTVDDAPVEIKGKFAPPGKVDQAIEWVSTAVDGSFSCGERVVISFLHDTILEIQDGLIKLNGFVEYQSNWIPSYAIQCYALITSEEFDALKEVNFVGAGTIDKIEFCSKMEHHALGSYVKMRIDEVMPVKPTTKSAVPNNLH